MRKILEAQTEKDYDDILNWLIAEYPSHIYISEWAKHKRTRWIREGLCQACSPIPSPIFRHLRKNTNAVEQTHNKSNFGGRRLTLLQAVTFGFHLDHRDIQQYQAWEASGIRPTYRAGGVSASLDSWMHRVISTQHRQFYSENTSSGATLSPRFSEHASTSGVPRLTRSSITSSVGKPSLATSNQQAIADNTTIKQPETQAQIEELENEALQRNIKRKQQELELLELEDQIRKRIAH
ncbi:hypothetical protein V1506DRAFT_524946 [Lipomyces tetrasporus]